jgi:hypothetical protein
MSDNDDLSNRGKEKTKTDAALTEELSSEVFDSSTYDSMTDLKAPATMNKSEVNKVLSDTNSKQSIEPGAVHIDSSTNAHTSSANTTVAPTMEGRASTLKNSKSQNNKSMSKQLDKQTDQTIKK